MLTVTNAVTPLGVVFIELPKSAKIGTPRINLTFRTMAGAEAPRGSGGCGAARAEA